MSDEQLPIVRISDAERDAALGHLRHLVATDRISLDRFSDAAGEVVAATTHDQLAVALEDLPATVRYTPAERRMTEPLELTANTGSINMVGRWQLASSTTVRVNTGSARLDLTQVEFDAAVVDLDLKVNTGSVEIVVPAGVTIQIVGGGSIRNYLGDDVALPGAPVVRLRAECNVGSVRLRRPRVPGRRWWRRSR